MNGVRHMIYHTVCLLLCTLATGSLDENVLPPDINVTLSNNDQAAMRICAAKITVKETWSFFPLAKASSPSIKDPVGNAVILTAANTPYTLKTEIQKELPPRSDGEVKFWFRSNGQSVLVCLIEIELELAAHHPLYVGTLIVLCNAEDGLNPQDFLDINSALRRRKDLFADPNAAKTELGRLRDSNLKNAWKIVSLLDEQIGRDACSISVRRFIKALLASAWPSATEEGSGTNQPNSEKREIVIVSDSVANREASQFAQTLRQRFQRTSESLKQKITEAESQRPNSVKDIESLKEVARSFSDLSQRAIRALEEHNLPLYHELIRAIFITLTNDVVRKYYAETVNLLLPHNNIGFGAQNPYEPEPTMLGPNPSLTGNSIFRGVKSITFASEELLQIVFSPLSAEQSQVAKHINIDIKRFQFTRESRPAEEFRRKMLTTK